MMLGCKGLITQKKCADIKSQSYLVTLTEKQSAHPHHVEQGVGITPRDPRGTTRAVSDGFPDPIRVGTTSCNIIWKKKHNTNNNF